MKQIKKWMLVGVIVIPAVALANMKFPTPPTEVTIQLEGVNLKPPFEIEISCFESRDGSPWTPLKDICRENPCSNNTTSEMLLLRSNLKDKYFSKCNMKVTVLETSSKAEMKIEQLNLENILRCEQSGASASSLHCTATVNFQNGNFQKKN